MMVGKKNEESGCFSGILRRILCQGSLQTHPSDQITEQNRSRAEFCRPLKKVEKMQKPVAPAPAPGVIARLMGLDSFPEPNLVHLKTPPDSVTRSRSVNFMDYLLKLDLSQSSSHRRVKTSVSFREVPVPAQQNNNDLLALFLDKVDEKKKVEDNKKQRKQHQQQQQKSSVSKKKQSSQERNKRVSKFVDEPRRVSVKKHSKKPVNRKPNSTLKNKIPTFTPSETSSDDSSAVSVFYISDSSPERDIGYKLNENVKKKEEEEEEQTVENQETDGYYTELVRELCRFTEEAIMQANWVPKKVYKFEDFEEVCMEFGEQILTTLLQQFIEELGGFNAQSNEVR